MRIAHPTGNGGQCLPYRRKNSCFTDHSPAEIGKHFEITERGLEHRIDEDSELRKTLKVECLSS